MELHLMSFGMKNDNFNIFFLPFFGISDISKGLKKNQKCAVLNSVQMLFNKFHFQNGNKFTSLVALLTVQFIYCLKFILGLE